MKHPIVRRGLVAGALLLAPAVAACAGGDSPTTAVAGSATKYNDADVTYVQGMVPHHEQAIEIAEIALDPSSAASAKTKELAQRARSTQDPEVQQMRALLKTWGKQEMDMSASGPDAKMSMADHGMLDVKEIASYDALSGPALDKRFAELMIKHHESAISQSEKIKKDGASAEVKKLADGIITGQKAEIADLKPLAT